MRRRARTGSPPPRGRARRRAGAERESGPGRREGRPRGGAGGSGFLGFLEIVRNAQPQARRRVHLPRGLLRVLEVREPFLHLGELGLDVALELVDLGLRDRPRVLVELLLFLGKAHAQTPAANGQGRTAIGKVFHIRTLTPSLVAGWIVAPFRARMAASSTNL